MLSACAAQEHVHIQGIDLQQTITPKTQYLEWESIISLGNLMLPDHLVTIHAPEKQAIGEIGFQKLDDGTNRIAVKVDLNAAKQHFHQKTPQLPNGDQIPYFESAKTGLMEIPIFENSRLYLHSSDSGDILAGIALNLPALDRIFQRKPRMPLLRSIEFNFLPIFGSAGVYLSEHRGQNGIYLFANKSTSKTPPHLLREPASSIHESSIESSHPQRFSDKTSTAISLFRLNYLFSRNATLRIK
jgi:hypothetical protein